MSHSRRGWVEIRSIAVRCIAIGTAVGATILPQSSAQAEPLADSMALRTQANAESEAAQEQIDVLADETEDLLTQYRVALRQEKSMRTYNGQMEKLIGAQQEELGSLQAQLDRIAGVSRDVTPLMLRMIDALDAFVQLDVPFLAKERQERIAALRTMMDRADVIEAEKYRHIMEAYQIENEFGRTIEAYRSTLDIDGRNATVDFLRVGRVALVYQSLDESDAGVWNQQARRWQPIDSSYRSAIRLGLRIARKQAAPDLIQLPLPRPSEGAL